MVQGMEHWEKRRKCLWENPLKCFGRDFASRAAHQQTPPPAIAGCLQDWRQVVSRFVHVLWSSKVRLFALSQSSAINFFDFRLSLRLASKGFLFLAVAWRSSFPSVLGNVTKNLLLLHGAIHDANKKQKFCQKLLHYWTFYYLVSVTGLLLKILSFFLTTH